MKVAAMAPALDFLDSCGGVEEVLVVRTAEGPQLAVRFQGCQNAAKAVEVGRALLNGARPKAVEAIDPSRFSSMREASGGCRWQRQHTPAAKLAVQLGQAPASSSTATGPEPPPVEDSSPTRASTAVSDGSGGQSPAQGSAAAVAAPVVAEQPPQATDLAPTPASASPRGVEEGEPRTQGPAAAAVVAPVVAEQPPLTINPAAAPANDSRLAIEEEELPPQAPARHAQPEGPAAATAAPAVPEKPPVAIDPAPTQASASPHRAQESESPTQALAAAVAAPVLVEQPSQAVDPTPTPATASPRGVAEEEAPSQAPHPRSPQRLPRPPSAGGGEAASAPKRRKLNMQKPVQSKDSSVQKPVQSKDPTWILHPEAVSTPAKIRVHLQELLSAEPYRCFRLSLDNILQWFPEKLASEHSRLRKTFKKEGKRLNAERLGRLVTPDEAKDLGIYCKAVLDTKFSVVSEISRRDWIQALIGEMVKEARKRKKRKADE